MCALVKSSVSAWILNVGTGVKTEKATSDVKVDSILHPCGDIYGMFL